MFLIIYSNKLYKKKKIKNTSGTVVPSWTAISCRTGSSRTWGRRPWNGKLRGDGTATREGARWRYMTRAQRFRLVTVTTKKKPVTVVRFFAAGRRFKIGRQTGTYGGWFLQGFSKNSNYEDTLLVKTAAALLRQNPSLQPRRRGNREFTPGTFGTRPGFRPVKIHFVT